MNIMINMVCISIGVGIAAYGEAKFDLFGVILQLGALGFEATRLVLIQNLWNSEYSIKPSYKFVLHYSLLLNLLNNPLVGS